MAAVLTTLAMVAPASQVAGLAAGQYILSGRPDGTGVFLVDDKLEIFLNGQPLHADPVPGRGYRQPIPFTADIGDQLRFVVNDTVLPPNSDCPGLSTIYLIDPQGKSTVATPGFYIGCPARLEGEDTSPRPGQGLVFDKTFTIPDISATGSSYKEVVTDSTLAGPLLLNGVLYGVTYDGGNGSGTIYRAAPDLSQVTTLYAFPGNGGSNQLGVPYYELTPGGKGFFGTTTSSVNGGGAIFEVDISTNPITITYLVDVSWFDVGGFSGPLLLRDGFLYGSLRGFSGSRIFRNSTITGLGPGTGSVGPLVLTATLRDSATGQPLSGRTLIFTLGSQITAAPTDFLGVARASLNLAQAPGRLTLMVAFPGDSVYAPTQATRSFEVVIDTDGDGLPDSWEISGVDLTGDGTIDLPLPAMGANPLRKDVFVEVDWMVKPSACVWLVCWTNGGVLQPQRVVLDALVARFAAAPVSNPDGSTGISLHVDGGPNTIMNPRTGEPWGPFSRAGVVPYDPSLGAISAGGLYDWSEFDAIKQVSFEPARRPVFHYAIFADVMADTSLAGLSRDYVAADFIVAAGHPDWNGGLTATQEASLFIHELGHNLGLRHGGGDDFNNKPNYFSSLNYRWALVGVPPDNRADYSSMIEPAIDETVTGDMNGDGRLTTLNGFLDWTNLVYTGGGIGDLFALPAPVTTPIDPIDPREMRERGIYARAGDGLIHFRGPSVLVRNSGVQSLMIDVKNISAVDASYTVSAESAIVAGNVSAATSVPAGSLAQVTLPVDTTGLVPGEYAVTLTLRSDTGEILHRQPALVIVVDLSVPENQEAARSAMAALAALPPGSGLDPAVFEQLTEMFKEAMPSWTAAVRVSGRVAFDAVYQIEEPAIARSPGRITVRSLTGSAICVVDIVRAGRAASGTVRLQQPTGDLLEARIAGKWDESTRTFDGTWLDGRARGGAISFRLREP